MADDQLEHDRALEQQGDLKEAELTLRRALASKEAQLGPDDIQMAVTLHELALVLQKQGELEEAESLFRRALLIQEAQLGPEHSQTAVTLHGLAHVLRQQGKGEDAVALEKSETALTLYTPAGDFQQQQTMRPRHSIVETTRDDLASMAMPHGGGSAVNPNLRPPGLGRRRSSTTANLCSLGVVDWQRNSEEAEGALGLEHSETAQTLYEHAVEADDQLALEQDSDDEELLFRRAPAIEEEALDTHRTLRMRAMRLAQQGELKDAELEEAELLFRRALAIEEAQLGPEHSQTAVTLHELAWVLQKQGKLEEAELLFRRALAIEEAALGPEHSETAVTLHGLALVLQKQGKLEEAELLFRRALAIKEAALGPEHSKMAVTLHELALVLQKQGKLEEAELLFRRALAIEDAHLGLEQSETAVTLHELARVLQKQGKLEEAELLFRRALAIKEAQLWPEHLETVVTLHWLALVLRKQGKLEEAELLYRRALAIEEAQLGPEHSQTAVTLHELARVLQKQGKLEEAELLFRRALAIEETQRGPEHPHTAVTLHGLALVLQKQGKLEEAELLFWRALAIKAAQLGPEHSETAVTRNELALVLQKQGKLEEAELLSPRRLVLKDLAIPVAVDYLPDCGATETEASQTSLLSTPQVLDADDFGTFILTRELQPGVTYEHADFAGLTIRVPQWARGTVHLIEPICIISSPELFGTVAEDGAYLVSPIVQGPADFQLVVGDAPLTLRFPICANEDFTTSIYTRSTPVGDDEVGSAWYHVPGVDCVDGEYVQCNLHHFSQFAIGVLNKYKDRADSLLWINRVVWKISYAGPLIGNNSTEGAAVVFWRAKSLETSLTGTVSAKAGYAPFAEAGGAFSETRASKSWHPPLPENVSIGRKAAEGAVMFPVQELPNDVWVGIYTHCRADGLCYLWAVRKAHRGCAAILQQQCAAPTVDITSYRSRFPITPDRPVRAVALEMLSIIVPDAVEAAQLPAI